MDIANHLSKTAKRVFLSHHLKDVPRTDFMQCVTQKPDVKCFTKTGAIFKDDSVEEFGVVVFCSGYQFSFPFLSCDSGIYVTNNRIHSLYKHCINIKYPTMAFIAIPAFFLPNQGSDLQVRFVLKYFTNEKQLPSKEEMMDDLRRDMKEREEIVLREGTGYKLWSKQVCCHIARLKFQIVNNDSIFCYNFSLIITKNFQI